MLMRQRNSCMKLMGNLLNHTASTAFPVLPVSNDYMNAILAAEDAVVRSKDTPQNSDTVTSAP